MKKILTGCLSLFMLMAIAQVLIAQPVEMGGDAVNVVMEQASNVEDIATNEVEDSMMMMGNAMEGNMEMNEEGSW